MMEHIMNLDNDVFLFFNGMHTAYLDHFMMLFTGRYIWVPMYAAMLFAVIRCNKPARAALTVFLIVLAIVLADQTCGHWLRPVVARLRPSNPENPLSGLVTIVNGYRGGPYGFPSCHAANSFALAMIMSLLVRSRRFTWFVFIWATINSYSRLYLGVHYPGDLLAGAFIGSACGAACYGAWHLLTHQTKMQDIKAGPLSTSDLVIIAGGIVTAAIAVVSLF